ncbi:MAG: type II secretion system F family protein [Gammaproteobacteria bacterium]|nr:type II secretion system F family protein [Gammaproteobacteria bacterium]MCF6230051.1 type II secretion system F family protein [Gammaproteobacteria bacterium]
MAKDAKKPSGSFTWEGINKNGHPVKGIMDGASIALIKAELRRQGIKPTKVKKKPKPLFGGAGGKRKITTKDITIFARQLATMMSAGVPLVQSFEIVAKGHDNPTMQALLLVVKSDIEGGLSLGEALAKHPKQFDTLFCNLVAAGEQAGILEGLLHRLATYMEKSEAIKSKVKSAMFYPIAVIVIAFVVTAILLIFVVPQFQSMFENFGGELPALTQFVVDLSEILQETWYLVFGVIVVIAIILKKLKASSKQFNRLLDRIVLKLPIIGTILEKSIIARFARTLSTMFAAGVPLVEAMDTVSGTVGNSLYGEAIAVMRDEVATGQQLTICMRQAELFPNMVLQMVSIGEETGALDGMLEKIADFYEAEVDDAVDGLTSLLEPLIMAFLGIIIGGLVIAMYLPIFKMGSVV